MGLFYLKNSKCETRKLETFSLRRDLGFASQAVAGNGTFTCKSQTENGHPELRLKICNNLDRISLGGSSKLQTDTETSPA